MGAEVVGHLIRGEGAGVKSGGVLAVKCRGKNLRGRSRRKSQHSPSCKMDIKEMVYQGVEWIYLAQVRSRWWAFV
jgi:hypothetical protein